MAAWVGTLGSMGGSLLTKDPYKPASNIGSSFGNLALSLATVAGTIGLTALASKLRQPSLSPVLVKTPEGQPLPTILQPGVQAGNTLGAAGAADGTSKGLASPGQKTQTTLFVVAGLVFVAAIVLAVMKPKR